MKNVAGAFSPLQRGFVNVPDLMWFRTTLKGTSEPLRKRAIYMPVFQLTEKLEMEKRMGDLLHHFSETALFLKRYINGSLQVKPKGFGSAAELIAQAERCCGNVRHFVAAKISDKASARNGSRVFLETMNDITLLLGCYKELIDQLEREYPDIPAEFQEDFRILFHNSIEAVEAYIRSYRVFFGNLEEIHDHIHKVFFWSTEAGKSADRLQKALFRQGEASDLSRTMHLSLLAKQVCRIAYGANDAADHLKMHIVQDMH